jgi:hypothetical protein
VWQCGGGVVLDCYGRRMQSNLSSTVDRLDESILHVGHGHVVVHLCAGVWACLLHELQCLRVLSWMLSCNDCFHGFVGVELEVRLIVVVLCSVRDRFLTRSEEIVRVCILFLTLFVALFVTFTLFCVFVWFFLLCKQFPALWSSEVQAGQSYSLYFIPVACCTFQDLLILAIRSLIGRRKLYVRVVSMERVSTCMGT